MVCPRYRLLYVFGACYAMCVFYLIVLYCIVLYCIVLCCAVLCCAVLCCVEKLKCAVLCLCVPDFRIFPDFGFLK